MKKLMSLATLIAAVAMMAGCEFGKGDKKAKKSSHHKVEHHKKGQHKKDHHKVEHHKKDAHHDQHHKESHQKDAHKPADVKESYRDKGARSNSEYSQYCSKCHRLIKDCTCFV